MGRFYCRKGEKRQEKAGKGEKKRENARKTEGFFRFFSDLSAFFLCILISPPGPGGRTPEENIGKLAGNLARGSPRTASSKCKPFGGLRKNVCFGPASVYIILTTLKRYVNKMRNINGPTSVHISFDGSNVGGAQFDGLQGLFP